MQVYFLNTLPERGYPVEIYYVKTDGKYYGWDEQNNRFYNLSTPNIDDLVGLSFENLQEGDVLSYDSASQTWINKVINTSTGVNSFNERQGDVYLLDSDVTYALGYTPEDLANKQNDLTPSSIKYPTVDAVNTGLLTKEPAITSGTSSEYWRGDKTFQTLDKNAIGLNNVDNTSDANKPISTLQATAIGLKEDSSNKSTSTTDSASTTKFPVWSAIVSYFDISRIKTILGITTLSGSNTGDQDLSGLVVKNTAIVGASKTKITYDAKGLVTSGEDATTADIADSLNKRYITDAQLTVVSNTSGTNTGDNATNSQYSGLATSKQDVLGFTPENEANKENTILDTSTIKYPTNNLVKTAVDSKVTANASITGDTKTKITYDSQGLITSSTDATTEDIADGVDKRYVTDNNLLVINNTSGVNTGDQTLSGLGGVPTSRNITVNGTISNLSADSTFTVTDANLSTSDITTNNVSTAKHGFAPKLANNTTQFLRADGSWASPNVSVSVQSVASAATVTPTSDNNIVIITAQAAALTIAIPTGTPAQGQTLMIRIKDNGTARAITWTTGAEGYRAIGVTLPTTTVINKTTYVGLIYNSTDNRWDAIGVATEA